MITRIPSPLLAIALLAVARGRELAASEPVIDRKHFSKGPKQAAQWKRETRGRK